MANNTSQHILNTSTALLGFCLIVISSIHISNMAESTWLDEFSSGIALVLALSTMFSFVSIRTQNERLERFFEKSADYLFLIALAGIFIIISVVMINFWNK